MPKSKKFPAVIYVTRDGQGSDEYLNVNEDGVEGIDENGKEVAVYKLESVGRIAISKTLK